MIRFVNIILLIGALLYPVFTYSLSPLSKGDSIDSYIEEQVNVIQSKFYYTDPDSLSLKYQTLKHMAEEYSRWHMLLYLQTGEAQCQAYFHRFDEMLCLINKSEALVKSRNAELNKLDPEFVARNSVNFTKGMYFYSIGDYQFAARAFEKVLKTDAPFDALGLDYHFSVQSYLGSSYLKMLLLDRAYLHYYKAQSLLSKMQSPYLDYYKAMNHMYLGDCKLAMAEYVEEETLPEALSHYFEAKEILANQENDPTFENATLTVYSQISSIYQSMNNPDSALFYLNRSLKYHGNNDPELIITYLNFGDIYKMKGDSRRASKYYYRSMELANKFYKGEHLKKSLPMFRLSEMYLAKHSYDSALSTAEKGLGFLTVGGKIDEKVSYKNLLEGLKLKAVALTQKYRRELNPIFLKSAVNTFLEGIHIINDVDKQIPYVDYKKFFKAHLQGYYASAIEAVNLAIEDSIDIVYHTDLLYQLMELNKGTLLREAINNTMALRYSGIPEDVIVLESNLKSRAAYYRRLIYENPEDAEVDIWQEGLYKTTSQLDSILKYIENTHPQYHLMKYKDSQATLETTQALLKDDEILLEYFWSDSAVYAIGVTNDQAVVKKIMLNEVVLKDFNEFIDISRSKELSSDNSVDNFASLSSRVFREFVEPLLSEENEHRSLIVVPDGKLAYIPFEVLLTSNVSKPSDYSSLPYLLRRYNIRSLFSSSFIDSEVVPQEDYQYTYLGYAPRYAQAVSDVRSHAGLPGALKYNQEEILKAADYFDSDVYIDTSATEGNFIRSAGTGRILHLAVHAFTNDRNPSYSGLIFSESDVSESNNALLHLYEIYNLSINARLVVLSGCETGTGKYFRGEGVISLGRAFRYAGCPNIVMSLWQVNDKSTAAIMDEFFHNLKAGVGKSEALRKAKLSFINDPKNKYFTHPYYWSGFVLMGDDQPVSSPSWYTEVLIAFVVLIAIILIVHIKKYRKRSA